VTAQQQLIQLPDGSRAILEAAALLDQPFSVPLLIDLGFSADALDPLFDSGIFRETFPNRAEFTNSGLRNELLAGMPWSRKRRLCEQVGELLIAKGLTNKEIASHLNLSARTIEMHVALALERLNCRTRSEGVSRAISQGLLGSKTSS